MLKRIYQSDDRRLYLLPKGEGKIIEIVYKNGDKIILKRFSRD